MSHIIVKTTNPENLNPCKIVTRPSGDNPYYLVCLDQVPQELESDIVEDTAVFLSQYDLGEEEEEI